VKTFKKRLCTGASLSIGTTLGNLHGDWFTEDFDRKMKEGSGNGTSLSNGGSARGTCRGVHLLWILEMVKEGLFALDLQRYAMNSLELGTSRHRGPTAKPEGVSLPENL
jgi:hypothetical protein